MRLQEALSLSNIRKKLGRLLRVAARQELLRSGLRFPQRLTYCLREARLIDEVRKEENLVRHALGHRDLLHVALLYPEFVKLALEHSNYVQSCFRFRSALEPFLHARHSLEKMNILEGSLYIDRERELVREAVLRANELPGPIIEIGTLWGFTTAWMAEWKNVEKKIVTVDNYCWNPLDWSPSSHKMFTRQVLGYLVRRGEVELVDMDKDAFYESYRGPAPSMVFLDADHSYEETLKDIEWAKRIGARIIAGHDYADVFGVVRAVEEAGGRCAAADSVWVLNGSDWNRGSQYSVRRAA